MDFTPVPPKFGKSKSQTPDTSSFSSIQQPEQTTRSPLLAYNPARDGQSNQENHIVDSLEKGARAKVNSVRSMYEAEQDPKEKLEAFRKYYKELVNTQVGNREDNPFKKDIKKKIIASSDAEMKDEIERLSSKQSLTLEDIHNLDRRKTLELEIETKYDINISEAKGKEENRSNSGHWSEEQLIKLQSTLHKLPVKDVKNNHRLKEIIRVTNDYHGRQGLTAGHYENGGEHDGRIAMYDISDQTGKNTFEQTIAHEIGHSVYRRLQETPEGNAIIKQYEDIVGWRRLKNSSELGTHLKANSGESENNVSKIISKLDGQRIHDHSANDEEENRVVVGNTRYMANSYTKDGYLAADDDKLPDSKALSYARSDPGEGFAEGYALEFVNTEKLNSPEEEAKVIDSQLKDRNSSLTKQTRENLEKRRVRLRRQQEAIKQQRRIMQEKIIHDDGSLTSKVSPIGPYEHYAT